MAADKYRSAEDQYFQLRGYFDSGRLTQEQFDEKLRELMIQDDQGRYWTLGADSGKWYYYDGSKWVQGEPYAGAGSGAAGVAAGAAAVSLASSAPVYSPPTQPAQTSMPPPVVITPEGVPTSGGFPIVPVLIGVIILAILAIGGFFLFQNRNSIFVAQNPTPITPVQSATITRAPSPTARVVVPTDAPTSAPPPTEVPPTPTQALPTAVPPTAEPAVTIIVVTAIPTDTPIPSNTPVLPTLLPTVTPRPPTLPPTQPPAPTKTATNVPPTNTAAPNFPPNVYVTKITYDPPAAKRNQNVTFTATFLNTTGNTANYNWLILLYDPNKNGNNKGFGESPASQISVPPGEKTFSITYVPVNGPGGCINLYMRAGSKVSAFNKPIFPNTSGDPTTVYFDVCPS